MLRVAVEVWPWLSQLLAENGGGRRVVEIEVEDGLDLEGLLVRLCEDNPRLHHAIYDPQTDEISDYVSILVNGRLPGHREGYKTRLSDGDRVVVVQGFAGGGRCVEENWL